MSRAVCTNLPAACSKAAARTPLPMSGPEDRCPECGAALLPIDAAVSASPAGAARWIVPASGVALAALAGLLMWRGHESRTVPPAPGPGAVTAEAVVPAAPAPVTPAVTQAAATLESHPPGAGQPAVLTLSGAGLIGLPQAAALVEGFVKAEGLGEVLRPSAEASGAGAGPLLVRQPSGARLELRLAAAEAGPEAAGLRRVSLLGGDVATGDVTLGLDALAVVVHPESPLQSITLAQLRQRLGGRKGRGPESMHLPAEASLQALVARQLLDGAALPEGVARHADAAALVAAVLADPAAIGLVPLSAVGSARVLAVADATGSTWLPTPETLAAERYPLTHRLVIRLPEGADSRLQRLAQYLAGPTAQSRLAAQVRVPAAPLLVESERIEPVEIGAAVKMPRDYAALTRPARLLTGRIDFGSGEDALDEAARAEVARLGRALSGGQVPPGGSVIVVALANDPGSFCANRALSERRATQVAQVLRDAGVPVAVVRGVGRLAAAGAAASPAASLERRAEIWVSDTPVRQPAPFRCVSGTGASGPESAPVAPAAASGA
ncbi:OmpA family protein [Sphaerotilus uruguayifluvii]|uniref:Phosphate transport system substrate-binding protein n=1 Tax=Sphaerotilus uruguayifluvii TaxID=2735897 RepID=A0ABX2G374_9BURK|nr:OmpA family protein [Leptothrix sp. C29]NRT55872.1 phosphate transport system substrate-binding protein [Leptothrix sp. C29]